MKKTIALILALLLALSSLGALAGGVEFSDAYYTFDGETHPLNPTAAVNVSTTRDCLIFDFHMTSGDDVLFPMQLKFSNEGMALVIGDSSNVYLFDTDYFYTFADEAIDAELADMELMPALDYELGLFTDLFDALMNPPLSENSFNMFVNHLEAIPTRGEPADGSVELDGETFPAQVYTFDVSRSQFNSFRYGLDRLLGPDYWTAVENFEIYDKGEAGVHYTYSQLENLLYSDIQTSVTEYRLESGVIVCDIHREYALAEGGTETLDSRYVVYAPDHIRYEERESSTLCVFDLTPGQTVISLADEDRYEPMTADVALVKSESGEISAEFSGTYANTVLDETYAFSGSYAPGELSPAVDLAMTAEIAYEDQDEPDLVELAFSLAEGAGRLDARYVDNYYMYDESFGCAISVVEGSVLDRTLGGNVIRISSEDDLSNSTPLMLAIIGLMGDAEKLMSEESVAAMLEATESAASAIDEETGVSDYYYDYTGDFAELPTFAYIPDGYMVEYSHACYDYISNFTELYRSGDDLISISATSNPILEDYLAVGSDEDASDGAADESAWEEDAQQLPSEAPETGSEPDPSIPLSDVSIDIRDSYARAIVTNGGYTVVIECFGGAARYDYLSQIIAGITYPSEAPETEADSPARLRPSDLPHREHAV